MFSTIIFFGIFVSTLYAQQLTTKCLNSDWTQYYERCYLAVNYTLTWSSANAYCGKYGAKLVEPRGYELNNAIHGEVATKMPSAAFYWTGYNRPASVSGLPAYFGYWSDGQAAGVEAGVWGLKQPDISAGNCAYVNNADKLWYMETCDMVMPFLCEMEPCPSGDRDTYMCNGKCLGPGLKCDGKDDCGNNMDEQDCASSCSRIFEGQSGTITHPTPGGLYLPNADCTWLIHTTPGTRTNIEITFLNLEDKTDFLEIYDGGLSLSESRLVARLTGDMTNYKYKSSLNFVLLRFISDNSSQDIGFEITWSTVYLCEYTQLMNYKFSNTEIQYGATLRLTSLQNYVKCETECDKQSDCIGFSYDSSLKECYFMKMLPILEENSAFSIYSKSCPGYGNVQGSVPIWGAVQTATSTYQQLATPLYPGYYMANTELEYQISASANNRITLEVLTVDLCCGDIVMILDKEKNLLYTLNSDSVPVVWVSTSNTLYIRMDLNAHWKCKGVLMMYREGCDISMSGSGRFVSPGYGSAGGYGDGLSKCSWTINAPSPDRSVTLVFEEFSLHSSDLVTVTNSDGTITSHRDRSLKGMSNTSISSLTVTFETSARDGGVGFSTSFSPGCTSLSAAGYRINSGGTNYNDEVDLACVEGYFFTGASAGQSSVQMTCGIGGVWSINPVPVCERAYCGPPPIINNGYIRRSSGPQGSDVTEYICKDGYTLTGKNNITCMASGQWEMPPMCTSLPCNDLGTTLSTMSAEVLYGFGTDRNSVTRLSCPAYSEVYGAATVSCQNGTWDFPAYANTSSCRATPCEVPVIDHAIISPPPPYRIDMNLTVSCMPGYDLSGNSTFRCGVDSVLPVCTRKTCSLAGLSNVVSVVNRDQVTYDYGQKVEVQCGSNLAFTNILSTTVQIECLDTGSWSYTPVCREASCYTPYEVPGSVYTAPCLDNGCSFQFACKSGYELAGSSAFITDLSQNKGDNLVRCGAVNSGLWDFGDLRCIGGQCPDPGYPASGFLTGTSFEEGALVTFGCSKNGYEPLLSDGSLSTGMRCVRDARTDTLIWDGVMPSCIDTMKPIFSNCPSQTISIQNLEAPGFERPTAIDNNAVQTFQVYPENFDPLHPRTEAAFVNYIATDYNDNTAICAVRIQIPDAIVCKNDISTNYEITSMGDIYGNNTEFFDLKNTAPDIDVTFTPEFIQVTTDVATLESIHEIEVKAINSTTGTELDQCTIQFRFQAPPCASWSLYIPNGNGNCNNGVCNATCDQDYYFMDAPTSDSILLTCTEANGWNREPPVCAMATTNYVIYTVKLNYKYFMQGDIFDFEVCREPYRTEVETHLNTFAEEMEVRCNEGNTGNHVIITLIGMDPLVYDLGTVRLYVDFEYQINVTDESASDAFTLKESCVNTIQASMDRTTVTTNQYAISTLNGTNSCINGIYDFSTNPPINDYRCIGNRKFANIDGNRYCLNCPVGYYYNAENGGDCQKCPVNTYGDPNGALAEVGATCLSCPNGAGPDQTGLTSLDACYYKAKCKAGYFSTDGLAPCRICPKNFYSAGELSTTCQKCDSDKITLNEGSTSTLDCLTQGEAEQISPQVPTPCDQSLCMNGATCIYEYNTFACTCPSGFTGRFCDVAYTACSSNPCENGQQCMLMTNGSYTCNCGDSNSEFSGDRCEVDKLGCSSNFCVNNGTCHNERGAYSCKCASFSGYSNNGTGNCGTAIDQCTAHPCIEGTCVRHGNYYRSCSCYPGYTDLDCSTDIDDCALNLCQNGATCTDQINGFDCECQDGFHGDLCQFVKSCDQECAPGSTFGCKTCFTEGTQTCMDIGNSYSCNCKAGYTGTSCEIELSPCNSFPCQHSGTCVKISDSEFRCQCREPWTGGFCETEIDNCGTGTVCQNGGTCYSSASRYVCSCPSDYIGSNCTELYDPCSRANPCVSPDSTCSFTDGNFTCTCGEGYTGESCQTIQPSCNDIVCNNGGTCTEVAGVPTCSCANGYEGTTCDTDINECDSNPCSNDEECQDGINSYTCSCGIDRRGENCDKAVENSFDYLIFPTSQCRADASRSSFGDGQTEVQALTVSFWVRYTALHGRGDILSLYATNENVELIPTNPRFTLHFDATQMVAQYTSPSARRKKRQTDNFVDFTYPSLADGYWWHVLVTWANSNRELTLYINGTIVDSEFFADNSSLGTRGFVVLGSFDPATGSSDVANGFEGRISKLFVVNEKLSMEQLKERNLNPPSQVLYPQRTLMLYYPVDYSSELHPSSERCINRTDLQCDINTVTSLPEVSTCPGDVWTITDRETAPTWTEPTFVGIYSPISTISSGTALDWGVYGVSYAVFDTNNNAALCTFRVYNRESSCTQGEGDANCTSINGMYRCERSCGVNQGWPGVVPLYLTCSMYGMWDQASRSTAYIKPRCSDATGITNNVTLELTATTSVPCTSIQAEYEASVVSELNVFNTEVDYGLCKPNCSGSSITCIGASTVKVSISFELIRPTLTWQNSPVTAEDAFQIAVGDSQVFAYASTSNSNRTVNVDVASVDVRSTPACSSQYQASGDQCVLCGAGTSYDAGTSTCVRCQKGTYSSTLEASCTNCPAGQTTASDGSTSADFCEERCFRGQYFDSQDTLSCRDCPRGYYQANLGEFSCTPCPVLYTTAGVGSQFANSCVTAASLSTTTTVLPPDPANIGASTEDQSGLETGVIVAIVLGVLIGLLILILILVFCCCKEAVPCLSKKKQVVSPVGKEGYYANKYGELDMRFVSYNLKDVREKKGRPLDREPIYEPPLSDDTGSLKTDISIHVPVFNEKMNGSVTKKSLYMSNSGQHLNGSFTRSQRSSARDPASARDQTLPHIIAPMTSSPRSVNQYPYENVEETEHHRKPRTKRKKRKGHRHRSSSGHHGREDATYEGDSDVGHQTLPKALSPLPVKVKSKPPADVFMRPSSPMTRPRTEVLPSQYEDFLSHSPVRSLERSRGERSQEMSREERSQERSRDKRRERSKHKRSRDERSLERSRDERSYHSPRLAKVQHAEGMMRIEVESDGEDLR